MSILSSTHLPCLLVDNTLTSDQMAFKTHLPVVHFMGSRVGGELLSGGISQTEHLFSKYPDLIAVIPLCPRLGDGETLWVDHVRGPFLPQALGLSVKTGYLFEKAVNWSRFILLNSNQYPAWMSEVQYSAQCLVREIILVSSGLFPNELKYNSDLIRPSLFSPLWWDYLTSKPDVQFRYVTNRSIQPSNPSIYPRNTKMKWIQTNTTSAMLNFVDKFVCGIMCDIQNTIKMIQVNKSSRCNINKPDSLSQRSQNAYEHESPVQCTLNIINSLLNTSKINNKLCNNVSRFTTNRPDSRNVTTNCLPQANCFEHPEVDKPVVYHYADNLVEESVEYSQQLSALHTHHLYTYVDKLISNAFRNANKLMSWSTLLSKQIIDEVKYSCVSRNHNNESNMMKSMISDMAVEFNKTNSITNAADNRLHEDYHIDEKSPQLQINQQNGSLECEKRCPTDYLDENQSRQLLNKCPSPELRHIFPTNNSSLIKDTNERYMKTHSNKYSNQLISSCINSEKLLCIQPNSIMNGSPHVFISEKLFEFSNSIAVQCLISAFREIYIQRMSYHLNQNPSMNATPDFIISNNNQDPSELNRYNHSNIRPPGLILDCGLEEYSSNYYADPQLRILIQWISATLVYNSPCSKLSYLDSKINSFPDNKNNDNSDLNKEFKDEISMEHSCSPLVCCTNGNSKLKDLQTIVSLVYKASWTAKDLFCAILDYFHYRSDHLKHSNHNNNNSFIQSQKNNHGTYYSTCLNFQPISVSQEKSKRTVLSLFDYLIQQFHNVQ
ncbi:unnamed protein product [Schistosoma spindalis]|nr:unnamed protein product [Schistosoma spindale]